MKLIMAVVQADVITQVTQALIDSGFRVTRIATTGGWLRRENATLLLGVEDENVQEALNVLQRRGRRESPENGESTNGNGTATSGGIVFVMAVEQYERY
jgi:uncharacterized protein YaaQ